jgi:hypothetical protein
MLVWSACAAMFIYFGGFSREAKAPRAGEFLSARGPFQAD